jgi:serine/threonine-protein kinase
MVDPPVREGDILAGKYRVERILGSGGMGVVVAAWHQELEQRVAVKFLLPEIAARTDAAERFRREARAAVKIRSEHVARVVDVGTLDGVAPYMVMEYLDGHDLAQELRTRGVLPVSESVDYILQACEAVAEAHANGIVHRDLKPANLFLTRRSDGTRSVKVLDFGISKSTLGASVNDLSLTRTSSLIGSPLYMSPEQMKSAREVDFRADIWALGTILFEMLAGRPPYVADSIPQLCAALLHDSPPPLSDFRKDVPAGLEAILLRCLAKERTQRWTTIAEFAQKVAPFGPADAKIHADRARRVLGSTEISLEEPSLGSAISDSGTLLTYPNAGATVRSGVGAGLPDLGDPAQEVPRTGGTQASWGKTGDTPEAKLLAKKKRRRIAAILAAGLLGAAAVFTVLNRGRSDGPPVPPAAAPAAAAAAPGDLPSGAPASTADRTELEIAPVAEPPLVVPADAAAPTASATPKVAAPGAARKPANSPKPRAQSQQTKSVPGSITDFGGRR